MKNRVALITGAGRGIGRAIALGFARKGARVAITARTRKQLEELSEEITSGGGQALIIQADLSDRATPASIVKQVTEHWGPVEILVNNAGVGSSQNPRPLVEFDDDFWDLSLMVNITAPYLLSKRVLPDMIRKSWGRIINIASINSKISAFHGAAYTASKHGVAGLTKATALEVASQGVTANAICPATTRSLMNDKRLEYDAKRLGVPFEKLEEESTPLKRRLEPEEIASMAVYLAGDDAGAVNGQTINVCGGTLML
jgi:NAD(P)-dependent dehydrogenase (short-subunit alcohol dehydrogenase family)